MTRGWDQRKRQRATANGSEGEVFLAQNALASALRAGREEAGAETAAGAEERESREQVERNQRCQKKGNKKERSKLAHEGGLGLSEREKKRAGSL